jgi:hypothetical protein
MASQSGVPRTSAPRSSSSAPTSDSAKAAAALRATAHDAWAHKKWKACVDAYARASAMDPRGMTPQAMDEHDECADYDVKTPGDVGEAAGRREGLVMARRASSAQITNPVFPSSRESLRAAPTRRVAVAVEAAAVGKPRADRARPRYPSRFAHVRAIIAGL